MITADEASRARPSRSCRSSQPAERGDHHRRLPEGRDVAGRREAAGGQHHRVGRRRQEAAERVPGPVHPEGVREGRAPPGGAAGDAERDGRADDQRAPVPEARRAAGALDVEGRVGADAGGGQSGPEESDPRGARPDERGQTADDDRDRQPLEPRERGPTGRRRRRPRRRAPRRRGPADTRTRSRRGGRRARARRCSRRARCSTRPGTATRRFPGSRPAAVRARRAGRP